MVSVSIDPSCLERLAVLAQAAYPEEGCGLLLGRDRRVAEAWPLTNIAPRARDHYECDPLEYLAAERRADEAGLKVMGIWHSHPDGAPEPSAVDLRDAWPGWSYVIVATSAEGVTGVRSWRLQAERFVEEVISA